MKNISGLCNKKTLYLFLLTLFFGFQQLSAQVQITYKGSKNYTLVERTDLRRYDNGKYKGLVSREVRSFIVSQGALDSQTQEETFLYDGNFYVDEDTLRASRAAAESVHQAIPSVFTIDEAGKLTMVEDNGYPSFRSFPSFTQREIRPGDVWEAEAVRSVDPLNKGVFTKMPFYIQYSYVRDEIYHGEPVYLLTAQWATRYGTGTKYVDITGDSELKSALGKHSATIYVSKETGKAIVVRDTVDETFTYYDGNSVAFKGTISLFTEYPPTVNNNELLPKLKEIPDLDVEETDAGLRLRIVDLNFKPDSPELNPGEENRLDLIAAVLKKVPQSKFLIEGHTARTGTIDNEYELSVARANAIAAALVNRGIAADRFICKGSGGNKPIATNDTTEGRAKNRRVEITILE